MSAVEAEAESTHRRLSEDHECGLAEQKEEHAATLEQHAAALDATILQHAALQLETNEHHEKAMRTAEEEAARKVEISRTEVEALAAKHAAAVLAVEAELWEAGSTHRKLGEDLTKQSEQHTTTLDATAAQHAATLHAATTQHTATLEATTTRHEALQLETKRRHEEAMRVLKVEAIRAVEQARRQAMKDARAEADTALVAALEAAHEVSEKRQAEALVRAVEFLSPEEPHELHQPHVSGFVVGKTTSLFVLCAYAYKTWRHLCTTAVASSI
jgi:hypothetical protein